MKKRTPDKNRTVLVFAGGGSQGAVEAGVLKVIDKKIKPNYIIGTGVGAMNAALYASGNSPKEIEEIWEKITNKLALPINWRFLYLFRKTLSLSHPYKLKKFLKKHLPVKTFEECKIPLGISATEFLTGEPVLFTKGKLIDAIMASSAIPPQYPPYDINGKWYVAGLGNNVIALDEVHNIKCEQIITISAINPPAKDSDFWNVFSVTSYSFDIILRSNLLNELALGAIKYPKKNFVNIHPKLPFYVNLTNFSHSKELIKIGEEEAKKLVHLIKK